MKEYGGHDDLHGSGHRSVISYVHRRMRVVLHCGVQTLASLFRVGVQRILLVLASTRAIYSLRSGSYNET
jgi:hypothetical protein